jgi:isoleucyl-tRNA synthetase
MESNFKTRFAQAPERPNFPLEEETVLKHWDKIDAFK